MAQLPEQVASGARRAAERIGRRELAAAGAAAAVLAGGEVARRRREEDESPDAYRLGKREPADLGMKRVARGRIEHALAALRDQAGEDPAEAVHTARKDLKKLRAAIRLVRHQLGDSIYRLENSFYRDAGRRLAGTRDAVAVREAMEGLRERFELGSRFSRIEAELQREERGNDDRAAIDETAVALNAGFDRVERWPLEGSGWEQLEPGLRRGYRRARNRFRDASEEPSDEALHEWRKRVKDLRYQVTILERADRKRLDGFEESLHELSDLLGDDHDLVLLRERSERPSEQRQPSLDALRELVERRRGELQLEAFAVGEKLFDEKPKAFSGSVL